MPAAVYASIQLGNAIDLISKTIFELEGRDELTGIHNDLVQYRNRLNEKLWEGKAKTFRGGESDE